MPLNSRGRAVFRLDVSPSIGGGHLLRCNTLADDLSAFGWDIVFAVNSQGGEICRQINDGKYPVMPLADHELNDPLVLSSASGAGRNVVVIDHYGLGRAYQSPLRKWADFVVVIDDLADRTHDCDILIDPSPGRTAGHYKNLLPRGCEILAGQTFGILRPEFSAHREAALARRREEQRFEKLLISFGMTDPENFTVRALDAIRQCDLPIAVDVVLGNGAPHLNEVHRTLGHLKQAAVLHQSPTNMSVLLRDADLAIGAAGGSALERCCLGLPSITLSVADNQEHYLENLDAMGAIYAIKGSHKTTSELISKALVSLEKSPEKLRLMSDRAAAVCDGLGSQRAAETIVRC